MKVIQLREAANYILSGKIGLIPTDTVYGIVVSAKDEPSVQRLFIDVKPRENKTGTVIASSIDQLVELGLKRRYLTAVQQFWPGPISVVIPTGQDLNYLHNGKQSVAVRIPKEKNLVELLEQTGPLLTTSANLSGQPEVATMEQATELFGDKLDFYVDGGDLSARQASTIIRINDDAIEVLRSGAVKIDEATGRILNK